MTVIDAATDQTAWTLFEEGVRPMAFEANADGSTKRIFVQLSNVHGFAVVDFAQKKEVARVMLPNDIPADKVDPGPFNASPSHGLGVAPDGKTLWVTSRPTRRSTSTRCRTWRCSAAPTSAAGPTGSPSRPTASWSTSPPRTAT